jgi:hypothetical protein
VWVLIFIGLALQAGAGVCAWRQPVRTYPNTLYWQAILVMMTGAGWVLGAGGALSAGWRWAVAYALAGAVAVAGMWLGTGSRWVTAGLGIMLPVAMAWWLGRGR